MGLERGSSTKSENPSFPAVGHLDNVNAFPSSYELKRAIIDLKSELILIL